MHFKTIQTVLFISLVIVATILFGWLISDYFMSIFWAIVLTILFRPAHLRIYSIVKQHSSIAALLTILFILVVVLVPIYILGTMVANEAVSLYVNLTQNDTVTIKMLSEITTLLKPLEQFGINTVGIQEQIISFAQNFSIQIGTYAFNIGKATVNTVIGTLLMLYILFFTLRDGTKFGKRIMKVFPLGDEKEKILFNKFVSIVHAMFKGTFAIAIVQGIIGGILFFAVGIQSVILWAVVMGVFALIPAVGPAIIWIPAGLLLLLSGNTWEGVAVLIVGAVIISTIDNLLRPVLMAHDAGMPDVLVLLSVFGGLTIFGIAGIIIGPVITAFFLSMWQLFEHDYSKELKKFG